MIPERNFSKKGRLKVKKGRLKVLLMRTKYTWRLSNSGGSESLWSAHASSHGASTVDFTARVRLRNGSRSAARESVVRRCAWSRAESASINRCPPVMMWRTSWGGASLRITMSTSRPAAACSRPVRRRRASKRSAAPGWKCRLSSTPTSTSLLPVHAILSLAAEQIRRHDALMPGQRGDQRVDQGPAHTHAVSLARSSAYGLLHCRRQRFERLRNTPCSCTRGVCPPVSRNLESRRRGCTSGAG